MTTEQQPADRCPECNGTGEVCMGGRSAHPSNWYPCPKCKGANKPADQGRGVGEAHIQRLVTLGDSLPNDANWDDYRVALTAAIAALTQPKGVSDGDIDQRARDLFASEYERDGIEFLPGEVRKPNSMLTMFEDRSIRAIKAALSLPRQSEAVRCYVATSKESCDVGPKYWVTIERDGETITPQWYFIKGRAEFDVAEWDHLLNGAPKPNPLDYDPDEPKPIIKVNQEVLQAHMDKIVDTVIPDIKEQARRKAEGAAALLRGDIHTPQPAQADTTPAAHGVGDDGSADYAVRQMGYWGREADARKRKDAEARFDAYHEELRKNRQAASAPGGE